MDPDGRVIRIVRERGRRTYRLDAGDWTRIGSGDARRRQRRAAGPCRPRESGNGGGEQGGAVRDQQDAAQ